MMGFRKLGDKLFSSGLTSRSRLGMTVLGVGSPVLQMLARFQNSDPVVLRRDWGNGNTYRLIQKLTTDLYLDIPLSGTVSAGGEFMRIGKVYGSRLYAAHTNGDAALSYSAAWTNTVNAAFFGGNVTFRKLVNYWVQFTTADNVTAVGCKTNQAQTGYGVALVTIDGDNTLANLLPTAQTLVDAGTLAATVLVANGGTLNPTDRVWNQYNLAAPGVQLFATDLAAGVHTVRLTVTAYKQAASSDVYVGFNAFLEWGAGLFDTDESLFYLYPTTNIAAAQDNPVWEISYLFTPTGATTGEWLGHSTSQKFSVLPTITLDGATITPAVGAVVSGQTIVFTMQFVARHSETGVTNQATIDYTFTFSATSGLTIAHTTTWLVGGSVSSGYPCMMMLDDATFDRAKAIDTEVVNIGTGDDTYKSNTQTQALWAWDFDGNLGAIMYIPDLTLTVNDWAESGTVKFAIKDDDPWNKMYAARFSAVGRAYAVSEVWQSECNYRIHWFADANAALA